MISIWKLIYDLEYWIQIGIAGDIVISRDQRPEYAPIVELYLKESVPPEKIPGKVLVHLKKEAEIVFYKRPTFWRLVLLNIKRLFLI